MPSKRTPANPPYALRNRPGQTIAARGHAKHAAAIGHDCAIRAWQFQRERRSRLRAAHPARRSARPLDMRPDILAQPAPRWPPLPRSNAQRWGPGVPSTHISMMSIRSLSSSGNITCVSGSPKRQLNSSTRTPNSVSISPAYNTPTYGRARRAHAIDDRLQHVPGDLRLSSAGVISGAGAYHAHAAGIRARCRHRPPVCDRARRAALPGVCHRERQDRQLAAAQRSSISTVSPAAPNSRVNMMRATLDRLCARSSHTNTPLPAASPSALTTYPARHQMAARA